MPFNKKDAIKRSHKHYCLKYSFPYNYIVNSHPILNSEFKFYSDGCHIKYIPILFCKNLFDFCCLRLSFQFSGTYDNGDKN